MTILSNLYAEKIFAEHPLALWALDENIEYFSFITESQRKPVPGNSDWVVSGGSFGNVVSGNYDNSPLPENIPFGKSHTMALYGNTPAALFSTVTATGPVIEITKTQLSISAYFYDNVSSAISYTIGYLYQIPGEDPVTVTKTFATNTYLDGWALVSATFLDLPEEVSFVRPIFGVSYLANQDNEYLFHINGIAMGYESEEFLATSLGVSPEGVADISEITSVNFANQLGVPAFSYGLSDNEGYYFISDGDLKAKNTGIPMVYGAQNVTRLYPNDSIPSAIFPSLGFMSKNQSKSEYTAEFWLRVATDKNASGKIFGPVDKNSGLFIDGDFIRLKVDNKVASYNISNWFRPMLIDVVVSESSARLMINAETVISIDIDQSIFDQLSNDEWIGFYVPEGIQYLELDAFAIYSYSTPSILAKRRLAYAQAVDAPDGTSKTFGGKIALVDYSVADYTSNYSYPDIGRFNQGFGSNITINSSSLNVPNYPDQQIVFESSSIESLVENSASVESLYGYSGISLLEDACHFKFDRFLLSDSEIAGMYGVFKPADISAYDPSVEQTIIAIYNKANGNNFRISLVDGGLRYSANINSIYTELLFEPGLATVPSFAVGFSIENIREYFDKSLSSFFDNPSQLEMYIGSNPDFSNRFLGTIYRFGLCNAQNYSEISQYFLRYTDEPYDVGPLELNPQGESSFWSLVLDGGDPGSDYSIPQILSHIASYTISIKNIFGVIVPDIAVSSYWQDSIALSHFAQYVQTPSGSYYDLDFIQFNIDYASNYSEFYGLLDTSESLVKTYVSFQPNGAGANRKLDSFTNIIPINTNRTVLPGPEWINTAYEVVDRSIIYMPKNVNINDLSIVTHLQMNVDGVRSNPIEIKRIEYASQAFNDETSNPIGTKHAVDMIPYARSSQFIDFKAFNPYLIYKRSTPYLYLTDSSGIEIIGNTDQYISRGVLMQVNELAAPNYKMKSLQMFTKPSLKRFSAIPELMFEIEYGSDTIKFFVTKTNAKGTRGKIAAIYSSTGNTVNGIAFYLNGKLVKDPILTINEWSALGVSFALPLNFDNFVGSVRLCGNMLFNAISYYESTYLEEIERQIIRDWEDVRILNFDGGSKLYEWLDTLQPFPGATYNWGEVLVISTIDYYGADIERLFGAYTGVNRLIADDSVGIKIGKSNFVIRNQIKKSTFTVNPV